MFFELQTVAISGWNDNCNLAVSRPIISLLPVICKMNVGHIHFRLASAQS